MVLKENVNLPETDNAEHLAIVRYVVANRHLSTRTLIDRVRHKVTDPDYINPVGNRNKKTGCLGTYRPVGATCPDSCPFLNNGCYAQGGNVNPHQRRASSEIRNSLNSAALALALGAVTGEIVRLHVSGDFAIENGDEKEVDVDYIIGLLEICEALDASGFDGVFGYTYTHIEREKIAPYVALLDGYISVMYSDHFDAGGAVVWPHDDIDKLREKTNAKVYMCPNQRTDGRVKCIDCGICFDQPETRNRLVAFDPHGSSEKRLKREIEAGDVYDN